MNIQEQIDSTDLDMTELQVRAFFLGIHCAEKPMSFSHGLEEILSQTPEAKDKLEPVMKMIWDQTQKNLTKELENMFPKETEIKEYLDMTKDQLDYFLTGMSLSGTSFEKCEDEDLSELIDVLEDTIEELDEYLADSNASKEAGEELKEFLLGTWEEFISTKK